MALQEFPQDEQDDFNRAIDRYSFNDGRFDVDKQDSGLVRVTRYADGLSREYEYDAWTADFEQELRSKAVWTSLPTP
jgi:hypothetical protein